MKVWFKHSGQKESRPPKVSKMTISPDDQKPFKRSTYVSEADKAALFQELRRTKIRVPRH